MKGFNEKIQGMDLMKRLNEWAMNDFNEWLQ